MRAAVEYYRKSAAKGSALSMARLGFCYRQGLGVPKDTTMSVEWCRKAALAGNTWAMASQVQGIPDRLRRGKGLR